MSRAICRLENARRRAGGCAELARSTWRRQRPAAAGRRLAERHTPRKQLEREASAGWEEPARPTLPATACVPSEVISQPAACTEKRRDARPGAGAGAVPTEAASCRRLCDRRSSHSAQAARHRSPRFGRPACATELYPRRVPPAGSAEGPWLGSATAPAYTRAKGCVRAAGGNAQVPRGRDRGPRWGRGPGRTQHPAWVTASRGGGRVRAAAGGRGRHLTSHLKGRFLFLQRTDFREKDRARVDRKSIRLLIAKSYSR